MNGAQTLIVGIGSPYGDDQAGWRVVEQLQQTFTAIRNHEIEIRLARTPGDLLNRVNRDQQLIICDACQGNKPTGTIECWSWPTEGLTEVDWAGTHDLGLYTVLKLLDKLERLPTKVTLWGIYTRSANVDDALSPEVNTAINQLTQTLTDSIVITTSSTSEVGHA